MELSKSLLQAIALGIALGTTTTACSLFENDAKPNLHGKSCTKDCTIDHSKANSGDNGETEGLLPNPPL